MTTFEFIAKIFDNIRLIYTMGYLVDIFENCVFVTLGSTIYKIDNKLNVYTRVFLEPTDISYNVFIPAKYLPVSLDRKTMIFQSDKLSISNIFNNIAIMRIHTKDSLDVVCNIMDYLINNKDSMVFSYSALSTKNNIFISDRKIKDYYNPYNPFIINLGYGLFALIYYKEIAISSNNELSSNYIFKEYILDIPEDTKSKDVIVVICSIDKPRDTGKLFIKGLDMLKLFINKAGLDSYLDLNNDNTIINLY